MDESTVLLLVERALRALRSEQQVAETVALVAALDSVPLCSAREFVEVFLREARTIAPPLLTRRDTTESTKQIEPLLDCVRVRWRAEVRREIEAAFADAPCPSDEHLTSGDWAYESETKFLCGKDWREHDLDLLRYRRADLSFVTPLGFHYLLPAFLLAGLEDADLADAIVFHFTYAGNELCDARFALLDAAQRAAVASLLRYTSSWAVARSWRSQPDLEPRLVGLIERLTP